LPQEKIKKNSTRPMQKHVGQMKSELVRIPKEVVDDEGDILDGAVMGRQRIQKQIMAERFGNKDWTFNERIVVRQILIVPDPLPLQSGRVY
jgi:hypothetical protein